MGTGRAIALSAYVLTAAACLGGGELVAIPSGTWAGPEARFDVGPAGGTLRAGCLAGDVAAPLALDGDGRFDLAGSYEIRVGPEPFARRGARFRGSLRGRDLTLELRDAQGALAAGPFALRFGAAPSEPQFCR